MTLAELQRLAGIKKNVQMPSEGINISKSATELKKIERDLGLKPGDKDWFKLWFSRPYWTGFPTGFRARNKT